MLTLSKIELHLPVLVTTPSSSGTYASRRKMVLCGSAASISTFTFSIAHRSVNSLILLDLLRSCRKAPKYTQIIRERDGCEVSDMVKGAPVNHP